jgi:hypothetical protein
MCPSADGAFCLKPGLPEKAAVHTRGWIVG